MLYPPRAVIEREKDLIGRTEERFAKFFKKPLFTTVKTPYGTGVALRHSSPCHSPEGRHLDLSVKSLMRCLKLVSERLLSDETCARSDRSTITHSHEPTWHAICNFVHKIPYRGQAQNCALCAYRLNRLFSARLDRYQHWDPLIWEYLMSCLCY